MDSSSPDVFPLWACKAPYLSSSQVANNQFCLAYPLGILLLTSLLWEQHLKIIVTCCANITREGKISISHICFSENRKATFGCKLSTHYMLAKRFWLCWKGSQNISGKLDQYPSGRCPSSLHRQGISSQNIRSTSIISLLKILQQYKCIFRKPIPRTKG